MGYGIIPRYRKWWFEVFGVVIGVKSDFVQVDIVPLVGDLQES